MRIRPSWHRFLWFCYFLIRFWNGSQDLSCYCDLLIQLCRFKIMTINPLCCQSHNVAFSMLYNPILIMKIKFPMPLSRSTNSNHPDVFIFILTLPEGREGEAWGPSNQMKLFPPLSQCVPHISNDFSLSSALPLHSVFLAEPVSEGAFVVLKITHRNGTQNCITFRLESSKM
jgi:hypothetical protein